MRAEILAASGRMKEAIAQLEKLLELAPDQVWTEERARGWWQKHQPPVRVSLPGSGSAPEQLRIADAPQQS